MSLCAVIHNWAQRPKPEQNSEDRMETGPPKTRPFPAANAQSEARAMVENDALT